MSHVFALPSISTMGKLLSHAQAQEFQAWVVGKARKKSRGGSGEKDDKAKKKDARAKLEAKLEAAAKARRDNLEETVEKAKGLGDRAVERAAKKLERARKNLAERLEEAMASAAERRQSQLDRESERLAKRNERVREASMEAMRARDDRSKSMAAELERRLHNAEKLRRANRSFPVWKKKCAVRSLRERSSTRLVQRAWRDFRNHHRTTRELAMRFTSSGVTVERAKEETFERFAGRIQSKRTLAATSALLERIDFKLRSLGITGDADEHLVSRVAPVSKRGANQERFPARVVLCAYMVAGHPDEVFNARTSREEALREAAEPFARSLDALAGHLASRGAQGCSHLLRTFHELWRSHLEAFAVWKLHDAADLEADLVRTAGQLKRSAMRKVPAHLPRNHLSHDHAAVVDQVDSDIRLLRDRIRRLTGEEGVHRLDDHVAAVEAVEETNSGTIDDDGDSDVRSERTVISSGAETEEDDSMGARDAARSTPRSSSSFTFGKRKQRAEPREDKERKVPLPGWEETLVNELLHNPDYQLPAPEKEETEEEESTESGSLEKRLATQMHKAFWDKFEQDVREGTPERRAETVLRLAGEFRGNVAAMVPSSMREQIERRLGDEPLKSALASLDNEPDAALAQLWSILNAAAHVLKNVGAPARDAEVDAIPNVVKECRDPAQALAKGFQSLFHQVKTVKRDAANAQLGPIRELIRSSDPSPALQWAQKAFCARHGIAMEGNDGHPPAERLPKAMALLSSSLRHLDSLELDLLPHLGSNTISQVSGSEEQAPPDAMASGRNVVAGQQRVQPPSLLSTGAHLKPVSSLKDEEAAVRLGLVELVQEPRKVAAEAVPETMELDATRAVECQNEFQQLQVRAACLLLYRQLAGDSARAEEVATRVKSLLADPSTRLNHLADEIASQAQPSNPQSQLAEGMLKRLTNPDDAVFRRVSSSLSSALRALVVLGPVSGESPARDSLSRCGSVCLLGDARDLAKTLLEMSHVNLLVHRPLYRRLLEDLSSSQRASSHRRNPSSDSNVSSP